MTKIGTEKLVFVLIFSISVIDHSLKKLYKGREFHESRKHVEGN